MSGCPAGEPGRGLTLGMGWWMLLPPNSTGLAAREQISDLPHREKERLMPTGLGNAMQQSARRTRLADCLSGCTASKQQAWLIFRVAQGQSQPMCDHVARQGHCMSAKVETTSSRNLVQHVDSWTRLELQGPTMDEAAFSTGLRILVILS